MKKILFILAALTLASTSLFAQTSSSLYRVENGKVVFPEFERTSPPRELLHFSPADFPGGRVYRGELLLQTDPLFSRSVHIPDDATTISITGRGTLTLWTFPRIRIQLVHDDDAVTLFQGFWQTLSLETHEYPIPHELRGKTVKLRLAIYNKGFEEEQRIFYFKSGSIF